MEQHRRPQADGTYGHASWRERVRNNPSTRPWYRAGVAVAGALLMLGAALTGWLPGPGGIPLFLAGLALWATEFHWAHGLLLRCKAWFDRFLGLPAWQRRTLVVVALVMALATWWAVAAVQGIPAWVPDAVAHRADRLPGVDPAE